MSKTTWIVFAIVTIALASACTIKNPEFEQCDGGACSDGGADTLIINGDLTPDTTSGDTSKCVDKDGDGYCVDTDCDDDNNKIYPGANELCDNKDNDCDGSVDNASTDTGKACGSSVGECKAGTTTCLNGKLECDGPTLVIPANELCDNKDNDCDGQIDEDFKNLGTGLSLGDVCTSGLGACATSGWMQCNGSATKLHCSAVAGTPSVEGPPGSTTCSDNNDNDCDGLTDLSDPNCISCTKDSDCEDQNGCTSDSCVGGVCQNSDMADGTLCSDGLYCNGIETCKTGKCGSGPKVLCDDSNSCTTDACDESQDKCVYIAVSSGSSEGTPGSASCLDGQDNDCDGKTDLADTDCVECQTDTDCQDKGACVSRSCSSSKVCVYSNKSDTTSCSDGLYCNGAETCQSGTCQSGTSLTCNDSDVCTTDACDETLDKCVYTPISGCKTCTSDNDCDIDPNDCTDSKCISGSCKAVVLVNGSTCSDSLYCTTGDQCSNGACVGSSRSCSLYDDQCNTGVCNEAQDKCEAVAKANGTACSDSLYCNGYESCQSGVCKSGTAVVCTSVDLCKIGSCDETQDICAFIQNPNPGAEGWSISGTCSDGKDNDCDGLADYADPDCKQCTFNSDCNDGKLCTQDTCNTTTWKCQNVALTGSVCNDNKWCTENDQCQSDGTCQGVARDCSFYDDQCNIGTCNESTDSCDTSYKSSSTTCDDGKYCTIGDHCLYGECVSGGARPCSSGLTCDVIQDKCVSLATGCADGTREGFVDSSIFPNIVGCSGVWSTPGLTNGSYLCASGWHICTDYLDVAQNMPSGYNCTHTWNGTDKRFFAMLQPSNGFGYCGSTGANDVFGCGNYGHVPAGGCGLLNYFSSEDCQGIKYPYTGAPETWKCGDNGVVDSADELTTIVKLQPIGGGVLCCHY